MNKRIPLTVAAGTLALALPMLAFAQTAMIQNATDLTTTPLSGTVSVKVSARITLAQSRADKEIDRRITALNNQLTRVQAMTKVSATFKASLATAIQGQISDLTSLKAKIDGETDVTSLRADIATITKSYRIFALVIPQGAIAAAADRIGTIGDSMTTLSAALQTRITAAQTSGADVSAMTTLLMDLNAKLADATTQSQAAVSATASLTPDNGDQTVMASNHQALVTARQDIVAAQKDMQTARQDAGKIVVALKAMSKASASTSTSTSTTTPSTSTSTNTDTSSSTSTDSSMPNTQQ